MDTHTHTHTQVPSFILSHLELKVLLLLLLDKQLALGNFFRLLHQPPLQCLDLLDHFKRCRVTGVEERERGEREIEKKRMSKGKGKEEREEESDSQAIHTAQS